MKNEIWKPVKGWELYFKISTIGNIWNLRRNTPHKTQLGAGYYHATIQGNYKRRRTTVHRLMAETFLKRPPGKNVVAHRNGKGTDNRLENLYWATFGENMRDKNKHWTMPKGENHKLHKLKEKQVIKILARLAKGDEPMRIAEDYPQVTSTCIYDIRNGKSWKHLAHRRKSGT